MRGYVLGICIFMAWQSVAHAQQNGVSMVRQAAIDRLQSKLGTLRGALKPGADRVFLTEEMIEQLKPIKVSKREPLQEVGPEASYSGFVTTAGGEKIGMSEIYGAAGFTVSDENASYDMGTTATVNSSGTPMDDLLKLADKLAAGQ